MALSVCVVEFEFCNRGRCHIFDERNIKWRCEFVIALLKEDYGLGAGKGDCASFLVFLVFFKSVNYHLSAVGCRLSG